MDVLVKSMLGLLRVKNAEFAFIDLLGNSGVQVRSTNKIVMHLVLRGSATLKTHKTGAALKMNGNDFVFCLHGAAHNLTAIVPGAEDVAANISDMTPYFTKGGNQDVPPQLHFGRGDNVTQVLSAGLQLDPAISSSVMRLLPELLFVRGQMRGLSGKIDYIYSSRQFSKASRTPGAHFFLRCLAELLMGEAIRLCSSDIKVPLNTALNTRSLRQIMVVLQLMSNQLERRWSVASLAAKVGMSRSSFALAFKSAVGQSPLDYLTQIRMDKAAELLKSDEIALKDVSFLVGYNSDDAFSRMFKHCFGVSPREYRKQIKISET